VAGTAPRRVALATSSRWPDLTLDDRLLVAALDELGIDARPAVWTDAAERWWECEAVVIRSCWDYHLAPDDFRAWLDRLEAARVPLWNPPPLARWNMDKRYLRALAERGVPVVPTAWIERGDAMPLAGVLAAHGWREAVVKPVVSASAHATWRTGAGPDAGAASSADEARFRAQRADGALMVQPFLDVIRDGGEWSLVFVDGEFSHAVRKRPAPGDFRVQQEHGGSAEPAAPPPALVEYGRAALAAAQAAAGSPAGALYARVDGCETDAGFLLMELELLEPSLFLGAGDGAARRLADAIRRRLSA